MGAARQLQRARVKLEGFVPVYEGLDVSLFLQGVTAEVTPSLEKLTPAQKLELLKVDTLVRLKMARNGSKLEKS